MERLDLDPHALPGAIQKPVDAVIIAYLLKPMTSKKRYP